MPNAWTNQQNPNIRTKLATIKINVPKASFVRMSNRLLDASFHVTSFSIDSHVYRRQAWESFWLFVPKEKTKKDAILARPCEMITERCQRLQLVPKAILIPVL